jgi:hypothetical protein
MALKFPQDSGNLGVSRRWPMTPDKQQMLELLKFELKFLEDGGYG